MIPLYISSIPSNDEYSNLSSDTSDSTDFTCTNCTTTKGQKGKRRNVEPHSYQTTRTITDYESGEIICITCGMVISDKIQSSETEWHNSEHGGIIIRSGAEPNAPRNRPGSTFSLARYDKGLYTVIGERDNDAYGRQLDPVVRHSMHKIRMYDARTQSDFKDRNRRRAFIELYKFKNKLALSDAIVEKTAYIYRKAEKRGIIRGRTIPSILAASLYIACREMLAPKTLKEIAKASNIRVKTLSKDYRLLLTELDLKIPNNDLMYYVSKVGNSLSMSEKTKRKAIDLVELIGKKRWTYIYLWKGSDGLAAAVLFVASANNGEDMTQREIATAAGLATVTIRCRLKEISKYLESFGNQE